MQAGGIGFTKEFAAYDDRFIPSLIPNGELISASAMAAFP
ncbi:hypothetical protein RR42_s0888 [Cupriavidus basilensis]|uniref:Uncharacterized protein n=1 Tax=Cupriavidus basilensis TaxID=68895 RepID=A0A0C4YHK0_9BURK|nr:hypothetical protein RR42_s0888 [Cupriavidus basilensis]